MRYCGRLTGEGVIRHFGKLHIAGGSFSGRFGRYLMEDSLTVHFWKTVCS